MERGLKRKAAGLKTHILICIGAMLFTFISVVSAKGMGNADTTRIISQIISGVGFLGAGAILRSPNDKVQGLTTAAVMWVTSALGVFIGLGYGPIAVVVTLSIVAILAVAAWVEGKYIKKDEESQ
jgi:putative Mg2+ transporter-C (MgtC) family protein